MTHPIHAHKNTLEKDEIKDLVANNMMVSVFARVFHLSSRLFLPPITLAYVGMEEYGLWAVCFILIGYLGIGAFGVSNVYIRYIAEYHANNEIHKINGLISTGIVLVFAISVLSMLGLWYILPDLIRDKFHISPALQSTAFDLIYGTASIFMLELIMGAFIYLLEGLQKFTSASYIFMVASLIETLLSIILLVLGFGIYALLYGFIVRYIFNIIACIYISYQELPGLSVHIKHFSRDYFKLFYNFGAISQLMGILSIFVRSIEKLIASLALGVEATGLLDIGSKWAITATTIPAAMTSVFLPTTSYLHTQQRKEELIEMYLQGSRSMSLVTGWLMGFLAAFAYPLMTAWLGHDPKYEIAAEIMILFTLPQQIHILTGLGTAIFYGMEKPILTIPYSVLRIVLLGLTGILLLFGVELSILNIVWAVSITTLISAFAYIFYTNYYIGVDQWLFARKVIFPSLAPYANGLLLFIGMHLLWPFEIQDRLSAIYFLAVSGVLYTGFSFVTIYWGVYDAHERAQLRVLILRGLVIAIRLIRRLRAAH